MGENAVKSVFITGGSRGIGKAAVALFAQKGYRVRFCYRSSKTQAEQLINELSAIGGDVQGYQADVSSAAQMEAVFQKAGPADVLVNNAGIAQQRLFSDITEEEWDQMFTVNVKGMYLCTKFALPHMITKHRGKIINLSSVWGLAGASCEVHYSASKAAVIGFTKALAKELGPSGIQVNCVAPGVIETDMNAGISQDIMRELKEETPLGRIGTGSEIAKAILFLASEDSDFITGQVISPNGGFYI